MNITGYKRKVEKLKEDLKKGEKFWGSYNYKKLDKRMSYIKRCIEELNKKKQKKWNII